MRHSLGGVLCVMTSLLATGPTQASELEQIDRSFARFDNTGPGCAVGVAKDAQPPILRAYGLSDLEHGIANTPATLFEAGSVSKQFTAAALLILAEAGRLSLTDDVRKYIPEVPDYGHEITLAELISHTSGLRDWGDLEGIAGWPRGERVYNLSDVLRITSQQQALNYPPGQAWSYTNTGYNLLAIIVERVSRQSMQSFSHEHLFARLGMLHTRWRDDFRQVVPGRAIAYERKPDGYRQQMPFENVIGNGGLLTTVGDLLIWNRALDEGSLGKFVTTELQRAGQLNDGSAIHYAKGLFLGRYRGMREISHSGATAAYRAWLARYPDQHLSVALLCNIAEDGVVNIGHAIVDVYSSSQPEDFTASKADLSRLTGWYADERNGEPLQLVLRQGRLETRTGDRVEASAEGELRIGAQSGKMAPDGGIAMRGLDGNIIHYLKRAAYQPTPAQLAKFQGRYRSEEAETTIKLVRDAAGLRLLVEGRPAANFPLTPVYADAFANTINEVNPVNEVLRPILSRSGSVTGVLLSTERVWSLKFERLADSVAALPAASGH